MLIVQLTDEQIAAIAPAFEKIVEMASTGNPGALLAQVYRDHMRVGVMSNASMMSIYDAIGTPMERRIARSSAYDS